MSLGDLIVLAAICAVALYFWRAQGVREHALLATRKHCQQLGLQLLDETVGLSALWIKRNKQGRLCLWRSYRFEFTSTGEERYTGKTIMLADQVDRVWLPPYRIEPDLE